MTVQRVFSQERLEKMLAAGHIDSTEYKRLRDAMEKDEPERLSQADPASSGHHRNLIRWYLARARAGDRWPVAVKLTATAATAVVAWVAVLWVVPVLVQIHEGEGTSLPRLTVILNWMATGWLGTAVLAAALLLGTLIVPLPDTRAGRRMLLRAHISAVTLFYVFVLVALYLSVSAVPKALG
jgi:hypothetical protein